MPIAASRPSRPTALVRIRDIITRSSCRLETLVAPGWPLRTIKGWPPVRPGAPKMCSNASGRRAEQLGCVVPREDQPRSAERVLQPELAYGLRSIAAPLRGQTVGGRAINPAVHRSLVSLLHVTVRLAPALQATARRISTRVGLRPTLPPPARGPAGNGASVEPAVV